MAAHLSRSLLPIVALAALPVCAQGLNDPTRPPAEITGEAVETNATAGTSPAQVVVISRNRRQATINGRTVDLGGRYGNATLVGISDEELVLQKPDSTEVIRLYSSVRKRRPSDAVNAAEMREE